MANELQAATDRRTGLTCYFILEGATGLVWDGSAFAAYSTANRNAGAISATGRADGTYVATLPAGVGATVFSYALYRQVGGSPAETDELVAGPGERPHTVADAILARNLAGGSDGTRTVQDALRASRNKVAFDVPAAGQFTVYREDDATVAWTGTYARGANTLGPLTDTDPA